MTTSPMQHLDERFARIAGILAQAQAAMAEDPTASLLVDLTDEDEELFETSLQSGEFLAFLDRHPQFETMSRPEEIPDLSWEEYAAAGLSVSEFVDSFRPR